MRFNIAILFLSLITWSEITIAQDYTLAEANKLFRRRDYTTALLIIEEVINQKEHAKNPEAWYFMMTINDQLTGEAYSYADTVLYTKEFVKAYQSCIKFDTTNSISHKANNLMRRKTLYFKHKADFEMAKNKAEEYIKAQELFIYCQRSTGKYIPKAELDLARAYQLTGQFDLALEQYMLLTNKDYETSSTVQEAMSMLRKANLHDLADSIFTVVLNKYPNNVSFRMIEINDFIDRGLFFKARTALNEILPANQDNSELHYLLGISNLKLSLTEDGIAELEKAIVLKPNHYSANFETGKYYLEEGVSSGNKELLNQSKARLEKCESIKPENEQLLALLRDLYLEIRDLKNYQRINDKLDN